MQIKVRERKLRDGTIFHDVDIIDDATTTHIGTYSSKKRADEVVGAILKFQRKGGN